MDELSIVVEHMNWSVKLFYIKRELFTRWIATINPAVHVRSFESNAWRLPLDGSQKTFITHVSVVCFHLRTKLEVSTAFPLHCFAQSLLVWLWLSLWLLRSLLLWAVLCSLWCETVCKFVLEINCNSVILVFLLQQNVLGTCNGVCYNHSKQWYYIACIVIITVRRRCR